VNDWSDFFSCFSSPVVLLLHAESFMCHMAGVDGDMIVSLLCCSLSLESNQLSWESEQSPSGDRRKTQWQSPPWSSFFWYLLFPIVSNCWANKILIFTFRVRRSTSSTDDSFLPSFWFLKTMTRLTSCQQIWDITFDNKTVPLLIPRAQWQNYGQRYGLDPLSVILISSRESRPAEHKKREMLQTCSESTCNHDMGQKVGYLSVCSRDLGSRTRQQHCYVILHLHLSFWVIIILSEY
jgi:hypothetical protein